MPAGLEVTVPVPPPCLATVRVLSGSKVAVTDLLASSVTVQVPLPEQPPPDQPTREEPAAAVAVSVTEVPCLKACVQVEPQLMPAGVEVTVPVPLPALVNVSVLSVSKLAV